MGSDPIQLRPPELWRMEMRKYYLSSATTALVIATGILIGNVLAQQVPTTATKPMAQPRRIDRVSEGFGKLQSPKEEQFEEGVRHLKSLREDVVGNLITMVAPKNAKQFSEPTRVRAAYLLGEYRAAEAAEVLTEVLLQGELGPADRLDLTPYDSPVYGALYKIGLPAVEPLINAAKSDGERRTRESCIRLVCQILQSKAAVLERIDDSAKTATEAERERLKDAREWVQKQRG